MVTCNLEEVMLGMSLIGDASNMSNISKWGETVSEILSGEHDKRLMMLIYYVNNNNTLPETEEKLLSDSIVISRLNNLKDSLRTSITKALEYINEKEKIKKKKLLNILKKKEIEENIYKTNLPAHAGTVAELAAQLGISKSEVRRRKAAGLIK